MRSSTVAKRRAASTMSAAFTPVIASTASGVYCLTDSASTSKPSVRSATNALFEPAARDDRVDHAVDEGHVGPGFCCEPEARVIDELDPPRVGDDQLRALLAHGLLHLQADDGVVLRRVGADDEDRVGICLSRRSSWSSRRFRMPSPDRRRWSCVRDGRSDRRYSCRWRPGRFSGRGSSPRWCTWRSTRTPIASGPYCPSLF